MKHRYEIVGCFDTSNKPQKASVTIDSKTNLVTLRIHRRRSVVEWAFIESIEQRFREVEAQRVRENKPVRRRRLVSRGMLSFGK